MEACGSRLLSPTMLATMLVCPAMAFCIHPPLLPISLCSVSLHLRSQPCSHPYPQTGPRPCPPTCLYVLSDPAQVTVMPPETPLPIGMRGVIQCPVRANPPLLFVTWTKDGQALQLDKVQTWVRGRKVLARCYDGPMANSNGWLSVIQGCC